MKGDHYNVIRFCSYVVNVGTDNYMIFGSHFPWSHKAIHSNRTNTRKRTHASMCITWPPTDHTLENAKQSASALDTAHKNLKAHGKDVSCENTFVYIARTEHGGVALILDVGHLVAKGQQQEAQMREAV